MKLGNTETWSISTLNLIWGYWRGLQISARQCVEQMTVAFCSCPCRSKKSRGPAPSNTKNKKLKIFCNHLDRKNRIKSSIPASYSDWLHLPSAERSVLFYAGSNSTIYEKIMAISNPPRDNLSSKRCLVRYCRGQEKPRDWSRDDLALDLMPLISSPKKFFTAVASCLWYLFDSRQKNYYRINVYHKEIYYYPGVIWFSKKSEKR